jgi:ankyrin repeat protein
MTIIRRIISNQKNEVKSMISQNHETILQRLEEFMQNGRTQVRRCLEIEDQFPGQQTQASGWSSWNIDIKTDDEIGDEQTLDAQKMLESALKIGEATTRKTRSTQTLDTESLQSTFSEFSSASPEGLSSWSAISATVSYSRSHGKGIAGISNIPTHWDGTPHFDDTTSKQVLVELIKRFKNQAMVNYEAQDFGQAETNQLEALKLFKELYFGYGEPSDLDEFHEMQRQLSEIYRRQDPKDKEMKRRQLSHANLQGESVIGEPDPVQASKMVDDGILPERAYWYYVLAEAYWNQIHADPPTMLPAPERQIYLEAAEREAKRAFKCSVMARATQNDIFLMSVDLLIKIYKERGQEVYAATYCDLYRPGSEFCGNPSPPPSIRFIEIPEAPIGSMPIDGIVRSISRIEKENDSSKVAVLTAIENDDECAIRRLHNNRARLGPGLFATARNGNAIMTKLLLSLDTQWDAKDQDVESLGSSPLLIAAGQGHESVVRVLVEGGADVSVIDNAGWSVVHHAAHGGSEEVLEILFDSRYQVDMNAVCTAGKTALHYLAEKDDVSTGMAFLNRNIDPNKRDKMERTPLDIAIQANCTNFVELLVKDPRVATEGVDVPDKTNQDIKNLLSSSVERRGSVPSINSKKSVRSKMSRKLFSRRSSVMPGSS